MQQAQKTFVLKQHSVKSHFITPDFGPVFPVHESMVGHMGQKKDKLYFFLYQINCIASFFHQTPFPPNMLTAASDINHISPDKHKQTSILLFQDSTCVFCCNDSQRSPS